MSTGITHIIETKEDVTFQDFVISALSGLDMYREGVGVCYPDANRHEELVKSRKSLMEFLCKGIGDLRREFNDEMAKSISTLQSAIIEEREIRSRYSRIMQDVESWELPSYKHSIFKRFMITQLSSYRNNNEDFYSNEIKQMQKKCFWEWLKELCDSVGIDMETLGVVEV